MRLQEEFHYSVMVPFNRKMNWICVLYASGALNELIIWLEIFVKELPHRLRTATDSSKMKRNAPFGVNTQGSNMALGAQEDINYVNTTGFGGEV
ncbi:hypothetical protein TGAMA5MH_01957 [Trichoderma gamsii]|uniref:Uncharacterized protein n=1 Tax=Trichoderma gamsii TaxID=398673 RepID=A0A2K0TLU4_9HYPO|nr:hypothetical protein TGAMA5MH_01957 [Trichoderma gamsii]